MAEQKKSRLKRVLLMGGVGFLGFLAVAWGSLYFISEGKINAQYEIACDAINIPADEASIARGKYLANHVMGCADSACHRADLGGGAVVDEQPLGRVYAPNLTSGEGGVTKDFADIDWVRIVRHGIKKNGLRALIMPSEDYWNFSDADIGAVIAYAKSVPPVDRETLPHAPGPVGRLVVATGELQFAYDKIDHESERPRAERGPTKEWGAVLIGTCSGCHGPGLSGGKIPGTDPSWPESRNLTPDEATGIGKWTFRDFETAIRTGTRPDGTTLSEVMPWKAYAGMDEVDVKALWEHLRTVPAKPAGGR